MTTPKSALFVVLIVCCGAFNSTQAQIASQIVMAQATTNNAQAPMNNQDIPIAETNDEKSQGFWGRFYIGATAVGLLVAAFGLVASYKTFVFSNRVSASQKVQIAVANQLAQEASERAASLEVKAAKLQIAAAQAEIELAKLKTPRTLSPVSQALVALAATPFKGQRYRVAISQGADDGLNFWESLYPALTAAGWIYLPASPPSEGIPPAGIPIVAIPGIEIRFAPSEENKIGPAALALGNMLHQEDMVVAVNKDPELDTDPTQRDALLIVIGVRVSPP